MNNSKNIVAFRLLILLVSLIVFSQTYAVFAQAPESIVPPPPEGSDNIQVAKHYASWCTVFKTFKNIFDFMLYFGITVAIIIIIWGGIILVISQGNPNNITKAKEMITIAIQGVFLTLLAWIIVNTIFTFLGGEAFFGITNGNQWYQLNCNPS